MTVFLDLRYVTINLSRITQIIVIVTQYLISYEDVKECVLRTMCSQKFILFIAVSDKSVALLLTLKLPNDLLTWKFNALTIKVLGTQLHIFEKSNLKMTVGKMCFYTNS